MPRPLLAQVHIDAMQHNLAVAARLAGRAKLWAVLKANAYGHGLPFGMRGFAAANGLALIEFDNALALREAGWRKPILMLEGCFDAQDVQTALRHELTVTVHCAEQIALIEHAAGATLPDIRLNVYLKLNSGMNRLGFTPAAFRAAHARLRMLPVIGEIALMTHFANADAPLDDRLPLQRQVSCFEETTRGLPGERTLANSATDLAFPELAAQWVRPGIMLYGGAPGKHSAADAGLWPAMTLSSELVGIQEIARGESVGYGSRFIAPHSMRIGIVACGYADGYPRHAPDGTPILVDGLRTRLVGRVSMDLLAVDLTPMPAAHVGTGVTLWGAGLPIDEVALHAGTIGYELMCALAPRVRVVEAPSLQCI